MDEASGLESRSVRWGAQGSNPCLAAVFVVLCALLSPAGCCVPGGACSLLVARITRCGIRGLTRGACVRRVRQQFARMRLANEIPYLVTVDDVLGFLEASARPVPVGRVMLNPATVGGVGDVCEGFVKVYHVDCFLLSVSVLLILL